MEIIVRVFLILLTQLELTKPHHASDISFNREEIKSRSVHNPNSNKLHTRENQQSSSVQLNLPRRMSSPQPQSSIQLHCYKTASVPQPALTSTHSLHSSDGWAFIHHMETRRGEAWRGLLINSRYSCRNCQIRYHNLFN